MFEFSCRCLEFEYGWFWRAGGSWYSGWIDHWRASAGPGSLSPSAAAEIPLGDPAARWHPADNSLRHSPRFQWRALWHQVKPHYIPISLCGKITNVLFWFQGLCYLYWFRWISAKVRKWNAEDWNGQVPSVHSEYLWNLPDTAATLLIMDVQTSTIPTVSFFFFFIFEALPTIER